MPMYSTPKHPRRYPIPSNDNPRTQDCGLIGRWNALDRPDRDHPVIVIARKQFKKKKEKKEKEEGTALVLANRTYISRLCALAPARHCNAKLIVVYTIYVIMTLRNIISSLFRANRAMSCRLSDRDPVARFEWRLKRSRSNRPLRSSVVEIAA